MNNSVFDEYVNCPKRKVSLLRYSKRSKKILEWLEKHEGDHHYSGVAHALGMKKETVKRYLSRFRKKGLVFTPKVPTIVYEEGFPCKGPSKPMRGYYEYGSSNLVVESVPNFTRFDVDVLKVHRVDLWGCVPGAWEGLVDKGNLTYVEAGNLTRYDGRSKVFNVYLQIFKGSAHYQVLHESVPIRFAPQFVRDFDVSLRILCGCGPKDVRLKCEVGFDFYAPDLKDVWEKSSELKIYNHPVLGRPYARTEIYLKKFNPSVDPKAIYGLMLRNLEPYRRLDNVLRRRLGVPRLLDPCDLRPKFRRF